VLGDGRFGKRIPGQPEADRNSLITPIVEASVRAGAALSRDWLALAVVAVEWWRHWAALYVWPAICERGLGV
jgi:hypothetical protein